MSYTFKTLTSSVSEVLQEKLYQNSQHGSKIGISPTSTALAMAITRLYYGDKQGKFQPINLGGILCLVADRALHSRYLRLYDINTNEMLF